MKIILDFKDKKIENEIINNLKLKSFDLFYMEEDKNNKLMIKDIQYLSYFFLNNKFFLKIEKNYMNNYPICLEDIKKFAILDNDIIRI